MTASAHRQAWQKLAATPRGALRNHPRPTLSSSSSTQALCFQRTAPSSFFSSSSSHSAWSGLKARPTSTITTARARFLTSRNSYTHRSYSSGSTPPPNSNNTIKFWPFVILIACASGAYVLLANRRKGECQWIVMAEWVQEVGDQRERGKTCLGANGDGYGWELLFPSHSCSPVLPTPPKPTTPSTPLS